MGGLITAPLGEAGSSDMNLDAIPSSTSERVDPLDTASLLARSIGNAQARFGTVDDYGRPISEPEPSVDADALNEKWGIKGSTPGASLSFTSPLPESVAQDMNAAKRDEIMRANAGQRSPGGVSSALGDLGFGMLDPVGIAASALPVFGEARIAGLLGRAGIDFGEGVVGRVGLRAATGLADAGAANAPLVGLRYGLSQQEQADYSMTDAARDLAYGSLLGGVLHPVIGAASDALHGLMERTPSVAALDNDPQARGAASTAGVAALMEDRPFDASSFGDLAQARAEREDLWFKLSQDSDALDSEIKDISDTAPADPATADRLNAIQAELQTPDVTADRRAELAHEASMLTEGAQATPDADTLYAARSQSQREGLQAALERNRQQIQDIEQTIYKSDMAARAAGGLSDEDAASLRQVEAAAKAEPSKPGAVPPEIADQIAKLEADIQRTRSGGIDQPAESPAPGVERPEPSGATSEGQIEARTSAPTAPVSRLHPEDEAELKAITTAEQASQSRVKALLQAGACLARGLI